MRLLIFITLTCEVAFAHKKPKWNDQNYSKIFIYKKDMLLRNFISDFESMVYTHKCHIWVSFMKLHVIVTSRKCYVFFLRKTNEMVKFIKLSHL